MAEYIKVNSSPLDSTLLTKISDLLKSGGVIAFPTDTVYGFGVNLLNPQAVEKVYQIKQRPRTKPLPILLAKPTQLSNFISRIDERTQRLMDSFWPGPLTLILSCDQGAFAGQEIGFRVPDNPVALSILNSVDVPLGCPSANLNGQPGPRTAQEVLKDFDEKIDLLIDAGPTPLGKESTLLELLPGKAKLIRHGFISEEWVDTCLNRPNLQKGKIKKVLFVCTGNSCRSVMAEGLFNHWVQGKKEIRAFSAGTTAFPGIRPSENAILTMKKIGVDVSTHLSQTLTPEMIESVNLVIAMTRAHQRFILEIIKTPAIDSSKVHLLMEFASRWDFFGMDVDDPIGQPLWAYQNCLETMKDPIQRLMEAL